MNKRRNEKMWKEKCKKEKGREKEQNERCQNMNNLSNMWRSKESVIENKTEKKTWKEGGRRENEIEKETSSRRIIIDSSKDEENRRNMETGKR